MSEVSVAPLPPEQYYASLARKRMASGVLLFDQMDKLLIVKPCYKQTWSIPGGVIDEDESPRAAVLRETQEEIGLELPDVRLICVHYTQRNLPRTESIQFVFSGGFLLPEQISKIRLQDSELEDFRFVTEPEAINLLEPNLNYRLSFCLTAIRNGTTAYLET